MRESFSGHTAYGWESVEWVGSSRAGSVTFRTSLVGESEGRNDQRWAIWGPSSSDGCIYLKFSILIYIAIGGRDFFITAC